MSTNTSDDQGNGHDSSDNLDVKAPSPGIDNQRKDPKDWVTGDEAMTGAQASYLKTLCEEAGQPFDPSLNKAAASRRIDALRSGSNATSR